MKAWLEIVLAVLVVTGVGGTVYNALAPDGWIADAFQRSTPAGLASIGIVGLVATFAWMARGWLIRGRAAQLFTYAFAGVGLVYLARFWINGSL
jgi:hypothetical protein